MIQSEELEYKYCHKSQHDSQIVAVDDEEEEVDLTLIESNDDDCDDDEVGMYDEVIDLPLDQCKLKGLLLLLLLHQLPQHDSESTMTSKRG